MLYYLKMFSGNNNKCTTLLFLLCLLILRIRAVSRVVSKCCPEDQVLLHHSFNCVTVSNLTRWHPAFYNNMKKSWIPSEDGSRNIIQEGRPLCDAHYYYSPITDRKFPALQENGSLLLLSSNNKDNPKILHPGEFCIDGSVYEFDENAEEKVYYSGSEWDQSIIGCAPPDPNFAQKMDFPWRVVIISTSVLLLII